MKISTECVFIKCSISLFFLFVILDWKERQKLLWLLSNAKDSYQCRSWILLSQDIAIPGLLREHKTPLLVLQHSWSLFHTNIWLCRLLTPLITAIWSLIHIQYLVLLYLHSFHRGISNTEARFLEKPLKLQEVFVLATNHVFSKTWNRLDKLHTI